MLSLIALEAVWGATIYFLARKKGLRPSLPTLLIYLAPAIPAIVANAWGAHFWVEPGTSTADRPAVISDMLSYCFYASIVLSVGAPLIAKGYRIPTAIFALPQIPVAWLVGFLGVMQVTGVWI